MRSFRTSSSRKSRQPDARAAFFIRISRQALELTETVEAAGFRRALLSLDVHARAHNAIAAVQQRMWLDVFSKIAPTKQITEQANLSVWAAGSGS